MKGRGKVIDAEFTVIEEEPPQSVPETLPVACSLSFGIARIGIDAGIYDSGPFAGRLAEVVKMLLGMRALKVAVVRQEPSGLVLSVILDGGHLLYQSIPERDYASLDLALRHPVPQDWPGKVKAALEGLFHTRSVGVAYAERNSDGQSVVRTPESG